MWILTMALLVFFTVVFAAERGFFTGFSKIKR
jgi:hypothetical protein